MVVGPPCRLFGNGLASHVLEDNCEDDECRGEHARYGDMACWHPKGGGVIMDVRRSLRSPQYRADGNPDDDDVAEVGTHGVGVAHAACAVTASARWCRGRPCLFQAGPAVVRAETPACLCIAECDLLRVKRLLMPLAVVGGGLAHSSLAVVAVPAPSVMHAGMVGRPVLVDPAGHCLLPRVTRFCWSRVVDAGASPCGR